MLRNMASSLFLTERDATDEENEPKVKGRITTTLEKAKEVRRLVEHCITVAKRVLPHYDEAAKHAPVDHRPGSAEWLEWKAKNKKAAEDWRKSDRWQKWNKAIAPVVAARRRAVRMLGDKKAVRILFDEIAPRYVDRAGGYTRVLKIAKKRQGDCSNMAMVELTGVNDRVRAKAQKPSFSDAGDAKK